ncbi:hypothetical protein KI387_014775, partial [Taxus chinensis]
NIASEFGSTPHDINDTWDMFKHNYRPWHVLRTTADTGPVTDVSSDSEPECSIQHEPLQEWQVFTQLHPGNNTGLDSLDMLGKRDFD